MKSPFPGMDPYIEACGLWGDFHRMFIAEIHRALAGVVPDRYLIRSEERRYLVLVGPGGKDDYSFIPDVGVTTPHTPETTTKSERGTALAEPTTEIEPTAMRPFITEEFRENFIEIYETEPEQQLVTCIEVLSPANKRRGSKGWKVYQRKRQALLLDSVNLVEIDLLRGGQRMPMIDPWPNSPYTIMVATQGTLPRCVAYAGHSLQALPTVKVPLATPDPDVPLSLQPLVDAVYAHSRYHRTIDYSRPLEPCLRPGEAAWLQQQMSERNAGA